ncbi:UPF0280 family protein [bacterium]|nr:UPF0280 family protein [bacterium]
MQRHHFEYRETIVTLICDPAFFDAGERSLRRSRDCVEAYIASDPEYRDTHAPYAPRENADRLVLRMADEAARAGVGPMASVAGALADACLADLLAAGADEAVVDNGGDIALFIRRPIRVGLYAGASPMTGLAFDVAPRPGVFGICTSSGTVGHSFSYGRADAAVVIAANAALADAAATALGNRVRSAGDLESCFDFLQGLESVEGGLAILGDRMGMWGVLPPLVRSEIDPERVTRGRNGP